MIAGGLLAGGMALTQPFQALQGAPPLAYAATLTPIRIADITIDPASVAGTNQLTLGVMVDDDWQGFAKESARRQLAQKARFGVVRLFDFRNYSLRPCMQWNESTKTGTFDWTYMDQTINGIYEIGAEPMICLGGYGSHVPHFPPGMSVDLATKLPYPDSFAAYASECLKHFASVGLPVRLYEVVNEPCDYFGSDPVDFSKLQNYMLLFNATAEAMRRENASVSVSHDFITRQPVLDYWLANGGADVDRLDFHKYDCGSPGQYTDEQMLTRAETTYFGQWPMGYTIEQARDVWLKARGKLLPVVDSELNFDSAWTNGTDPRIQQMVGAVWSALVLRMSIIHGLQQSIYYCLSSSASYGKATQTGGAGFGLSNSDTETPWYPFYVHDMIGNNLAPGDQLVMTKSSSEDIRTLAWLHGGIVNVLLISKSPVRIRARIVGINGQIKYRKIDETIPWQTPAEQTRILGGEKAVDCNGYTVTLLQASP